VQFGIARASYGDCLRCPETTDACGAGFYYKTCDASLKPSCSLNQITNSAELQQWLEALRTAAQNELDQGHRVSL
jgi:hypothetical protein